MEFRKGVLELREILLMLWGITNVQDRGRVCRVMGCSRLQMGEILIIRAILAFITVPVRASVHHWQGQSLLT